MAKGLFNKDEVAQEQRRDARPQYSMGVVVETWG